MRKLEHSVRSCLQLTLHRLDLQNTANTAVTWGPLFRWLARLRSCIYYMCQVIKQRNRNVAQKSLVSVSSMLVRELLFLCVTKYHAMKTYGESGGVSPRILNRGTRWRWVVSFGLRPFSYRHPLERRLDRPQNDPKLRVGTGRHIYQVTWRTVILPRRHTVLVLCTQSLPPLPQCVFVAWCLIKQWMQFMTWYLVKQWELG
jgi:hypothetical protein